MIDTILSITKNVIDFIHRNKEIKKQKKETLSVVLAEISEIMGDTAAKLRDDQYPHGNCAVLESLSRNLHSEVLEFIPDEQSSTLLTLLIEASNIEKKYYTRKEKNTISELEIISGEFKAMSILLKLN